MRKSLKIALPILGLSMVTVPIVAQASDDNLGCTFALCIASPNPMGIKECVSPVKTVLKRLAKGKGLPTCSLVNEKGTTSQLTSIPKITYARATPLPPCPVGQKFGADNVVYHAGAKPTGLVDKFWTKTNISGGIQSIKSGGDDTLWQSPYRSRVCIGGSYLGAFTDRYRDSDETVSIVHQWYQNVTSVTPDGATWEFNVDVDGNYKTYHRF